MVTAEAAERIASGTCVGDGEVLQPPLDDGAALLVGASAPSPVFPRRMGENCV